MSGEEKEEREIKTVGKQFKRKAEKFSNIWKDDNTSRFLDSKSEQYVQPLEFGGNTLHLVAGKPILEDGKVSDKYTVALAYSDEWISKDYREYKDAKKSLDIYEKAGYKDLDVSFTKVEAAQAKEQAFTHVKNSSRSDSEKSSHKKIYEEIEKRVKNGQATHLEKLYLRQIQEAELDAAMNPAQKGMNEGRFGKAIYSKEEIAGTKKVVRSNAKYDWYYKADPKKDKEIVEASSLKFWITDKERAEAKKRIEYRKRLETIRASRGNDSWNPWQCGYIDGKVFLLGQNEPENTNNEENLLAQNVSQSLKNQRTVAEKTLSHKTKDIEIAANTPQQNTPENTSSQKQQTTLSPQDVMRLKQNQNDMA
ncbi:MAG: hypothetical protein J6J35_05670 [Alphaproteobacteria bacterium]|nr:hypothetical protein [Alphaproteobacteria bacterium]